MTLNIEPIASQEEVRMVIHENLPEKFVDYYLDAPAPDPITGKPMPMQPTTDVPALISVETEARQPDGIPVVSIMPVKPTFAAAFVPKVSTFFTQIFHGNRG